MQPHFVTESQEAFASNQHVFLNFNTEDRYISPGSNIPPSNLEYCLASTFRNQGFRVVQYTPSLGVMELTPSGESSQSIEKLANVNDPVAVFNGLQRLLQNTNAKILVLIQYNERLAPPQGPGGAIGREEVPVAEIMHRLAMHDGILSTPNRMVGITYTGLPDELLSRSRRFRVINVGLPSLEERHAFIKFLDDQAKNGNPGFGRPAEDVSINDLAQLTAGMALFGIEAMYRISAFRGEPITRQIVRDAKTREIRQLTGDLAEVSEPTEGFESVAGLYTVKAFFLTIIRHLREGRPGVPQAVLLQGVPGVGKSHFVRALAAELGWPLIELRNVRSMWVGESERNLERIIQVVLQLWPCILFFDEIDQILGQRSTGASGDSGTSERILARIFTLMGGLTHRGRILFLGATNRSDILDPALLDRFGVSIPFLKPGVEEIRELIPLLLDRFNLSSTDVDLEKAAYLIYEKSPTGRDIQEIIISAGLIADAETGKVGSEIREDHLRAAIEDHICREDIVEMEYLTLIALSLCSKQSLLPWRDDKGLRPGAEIPDNLLELGVVGDDGRQDHKRLHQVISQIKRQRFSDRMMR